MATGDVRCFTATISGFDEDTGDPSSQAWKQLTGTEDLGQTATELFVVDNGLVRFVLDKNGSNRWRVLAFSNTLGTWHVIHENKTSTGVEGPKVLRFLTNTRHEARFIFEAGSGGPEDQYECVVRRGIPFVALKRLSGTSGNYVWGTPGNNVANAIFQHGSASPTESASDRHGKTNFNFGSTDTEFIAVWRPDAELISMTVQSKPNSQLAFVGGSYLGMFRTWAVGSWKWLGALQNWSFGLGDGGGASQGNGDGQFREGEDNFTAVSGAWTNDGKDGVSAGQIGFSSDRSARKNSPGTGDEVKWAMDFPHRGEYYVGVMGRGNAGTVNIDVGVNDGGLSFTGSPQALPTGELDTVEEQLLFGPFTIACSGTGPGQKDVHVKVTSVSGGPSSVDIDFVVLYPWKRCGSTANTVVFPKDMADSLLRMTKALPGRVLA